MTHQRELPAWLSFPDFERVEWLNSVLAQLWPHAAAAVVAQARPVVTTLGQRIKPTPGSAIRTALAVQMERKPQCSGHVHKTALHIKTWKRI